MKNTQQKTRMLFLDALRCLAMLMVVILHFLDKGNLLGPLDGTPLTASGAAAWALEALCIVAVNVYMLISGYFLSASSFKLRRLLSLYIQLWMYSALVGLLAVALGIAPAADMTTYDYLMLLLPLSMNHYWFLSAYLFLYILLPFLGEALKRLPKKALLVSIFLLLALQCGTKSLLPVSLEADAKGYDTLWYVTLFAIAACIRRFGLPGFLQKKRGLVLYFGCAALSFAELLALYAVYLRTGAFSYILKVSYQYNHLWVFLAALGLFAFCLTRDEKRAARLAKTEEASPKQGTSGLPAKLIAFAAPYTLGVYLLHENSTLRYLWPTWLGADAVNSIGGLLLHSLLAALVVFVLGVAVECLRSKVLDLLHGLLLRLPLYKKAYQWICATEHYFRDKAEVHA